MSRKTRLIVFIALVFALSFAFVVDTHHPAQAQTSNVVFVETDAVNIRSGPAPNMTILGTVYGGTSLSVTGRNADMTWWRVNSAFGVGWISNLHVVFRGTLATVPIVNTPAGTLETPVAFIDGYPATVYRNPDFDSFVIGIAPTGASLDISGRSMDGNWWQVETILGPGWVNIASVALRGDEKIVPYLPDPGPSFDGPTVQVNVDTPVTVKPGDGEVVGILLAGTALPAGGRTEDNSWWQVYSEFGIGWIPVANVSLAGASSNLVVTSGTTTPGPAYTGETLMSAKVEAKRKVAYEDYSFSSDPMWAANLGEELNVTARSADGLWLEVTNDMGYVGWMHFSGLTLNGSFSDLPIHDTDPVYENIVIINTHMLHVRSGPGFEYESLALLPGGAPLKVTGKHPDLPYIRVKDTFGEGWVRIMYVIFRGDWKTVPYVTEPIGDLELPTAVVDNPHHVYSEPSLQYPVGTIDGGIYTIIGWSPAYQWALIQTPLGDVWIQSAEFAMRGIMDNVPIIP